MIVGGVTAPFTHCAWVTVGFTGVAGVHEAAVRVTGNVAVVGVTCVQPGGSGRAQANPSANVAVTVTVVVTVPS